MGLRSLLDVETEGITGKLAAGADLPVTPPAVGTGLKYSRGASNGWSDSVATLATAASADSAPSPLLWPDSNSLCRCPQYNSPWNDTTGNSPH